MNHLMLMIEKRTFKILFLIILLLICIACNKYNEKQDSIYGTFIDINNKNVSVKIDSNNKITIDYSGLEGNIFSSTYSISNNNEIKSSILPRGGARIYFDNNSIIKFYPLDKTYTRDIEYIYGTSFKRKN